MTNFCLFCWLTPFENWWFALKDNLFEFGWRFFAGCNKWYEYGGWHRVTLIICEVIIMYGIGITYLWLRRKK